LTTEQQEDTQKLSNNRRMELTIFKRPTGLVLPFVHDNAPLLHFIEPHVYIKKYVSIYGLLLNIIHFITNKLSKPQNWEQISLPAGTPSLDAVFFLSEDKGWIIGSEWSPDTTMIYTTNNGGDDWVLLNTFEHYSSSSSIHFFDENIGWLATGRDIYKTTDGGENWTLEIEGGGGNFYDMYFTGNGKGIAVGAYYDSSNRTNIFLTSDNGENWESINTGSGGDFFGASTFFIDESTGWILRPNGGNGQKTTDGGYTWSPFVIDAQSYFRTFHFIDENTGFAAGEDVIFKTTDGGENWTQIYDAVGLIDDDEVNFYDIHFTNQNYGWAFGDGGYGTKEYIIKTTDGGLNWELEHEGSGIPRLEDAFFLGTENAWVVGRSASSGRMYKYNGNLSTDEVNFSDTINIYPNPAKDQITINSTSNNQIGQVEIFNLLGAKVDEVTVNNHEAVIDVSTLKTGTYFLKIYADSGVSTEKIIKQ